MIWVKLAADFDIVDILMPIVRRITMADFDSQKKDLMKEVRSVLDEVEDLYESAGDNGSEQAKELKDQLRKKLGNTKSKLSDLESTLADKARATAERTDELVREQPYYAMGIAAAAGFITGLMLGRCKH
jgi:ElaB protein